MSGRAARAGAALALAAAVSSAACPAAAQNAEQFYFSDEAALIAGAVVASPDDPGGLWYNPAALGGIHRARVSLSGSVIGVRARTIPNALETRVGPTRRTLDLAATDLISTPHAFTLLFGPSDEATLGFGVYVTTRDVESAESHALAEALPLPSEAVLDRRIDLLSNVTKVVFGPGAGFSLAPDVRLGFALFGSLMEATTTSEAIVGVAAPSGEALAASSTRVSTSAWGLALTGGLQWDVSRNVHLGLAVRSPELVLSGGSSILRTVVASSEGQTSAVTTVDELEGAPGLSEPPRVVLGAALDVAPRLRLALEMALASGLENDALLLDARATVNGRVGLRWSVGDTLTLGGGVFTDVAANVAPGPTLGASRVDYVGGTLGATLLTPVSVAGREGADALVLATTIALRYSAGFGIARALSTDGSAFENRTVSVTFHDFMPYTGSTVLF